MKLKDAKERLNSLVGKEFGQVFSKEQLQDIIRNKGKSGQILELALGLENSSKPLDFEDGELKTNKCDRDGNPKETMFITQIHSIIDELLEQKIFMKRMFIRRFQTYCMFLFVKLEPQKNGCFYLVSTWI